MLLLTAATGLGLLPRAELRALEAFTIEAYHVEMLVREDNSYAVTERLDLNFSERRHGLIRSIPLLTYRERLAEVREVSANVHFDTCRDGTDFEIRLGDEESYVEGPVRYEISYVYDLGDDGLRDMDEVYFNLIGTDWDTSISGVSFKITMPKAFPAEGLNFTYGKTGSSEKAPLSLTLTDTTIEGRLETVLAPYEGLTMALPLPEGYFTGEMRQAADPLLRAEPFIYLGALLFGIFLIIMVKLRNHRSTSVEFYPPADINPADMSYFCRGKVTQRGISALILHWVNTGYFRMDEIDVPKRFKKSGKDIVLTPLAEPGPEMKDYEKKLFRRLLQQQNTEGYIRLGALPLSFHSHFTAAMKGAEEYWKSDERRVFSKATKIWRALAYLFSAGIIYFSLWRFTGFYLAGGDMPPWMDALFMMLFVYVLGISRFGSSFAALIGSGEEKPKAGRFIISLLLYILFFGLMLTMAMMRDAKLRAVYLGAAYIISTFLNVIGHKIILYTPYGRQRMQQLDGFITFLKRTDKGAGSAFDVNYFAYNMAFAYALNLAKQWTKTFSRLTAARFGAAEAMRWNRYAEDYLYDYDRRMQALDRTVERAPKDSSDSSSGSGGSSSGGSSGGGSGGGGGRSW